MAKKVFKWWLPKGSSDALKRAKTVMDVNSILLEASSSRNKKWFLTNERPPERVTVTVEMEAQNDGNAQNQELQGQVG